MLFLHSDTCANYSNYYFFDWSVCWKNVERENISIHINIKATCKRGALFNYVDQL